jgi:hypothetical protein
MNKTERATERNRIKVLNDKQNKRYKGTINPIWTNPRGSIKRALLGLSPISYLNNISDTHGSFIY